jgi:hypothetical protein
MGGGQLTLNLTGLARPLISPLPQPSTATAASCSIFPPSVKSPPTSFPKRRKFSPLMITILTVRHARACGKHKNGEAN